ncbi:hypothetical protein M885DRAFT_522381 [Pelagophyceae sp. CCMP2097]|nr:hypothetical protein M885DRAFT_522381 [Pelagophyceae sp. CCMP2097]
MVAKESSKVKKKAHPLRAAIHSDELRYVSSLGNLDENVSPPKHRAPPREAKAGGGAKKLAQQKKLASGLRNENGDRMSNEQQQACLRCLVVLEQQQSDMFDRRSDLGARMNRTGRKLAEALDRLASVEKENGGVEAQAKHVKAEIVERKEARAEAVASLDAMRADVEEVKSRTLVALDLRKNALRQELRDLDRQLKNAIWSTGSNGDSVNVGVGADAPLPPLPPVEPIVLAPVRRYADDARPGDAKPKAGGRPATTGNIADSFAVRKYGMHANMALKDVGEIDHSYAPPLGLLRDHSVSSRGIDLFNKLVGSGKVDGHARSAPYLTSLPTRAATAMSHSRRPPGSQSPGVTHDRRLIPTHGY